MVFHTERKNLISLVAALLLTVSGTSLFASGSLTFPTSELCAATATSSPFEFSLVPDLLFASTGVGTTAASLIMQNTKDFPDWNGTLYNINDVNAFDRWAMQPYSKQWDNAGTVSCGLDLAMPVLLYGTEAIMGNFPTNELLPVAAMYAESFLLSYGIKGILKMTVLRVRPYMYFDGYPEDAISNSDFEFSWPSGHTTNAFMGAVFTACTFAWYYPNSVYRIPVTCTALGIAVATGVMRMLSGNHFLSDVLTGAALGSLCGFIVPYMHHVVAEQSNKKGNENNTAAQKLSASVSPYGILFKLYL